MPKRHPTIGAPAKRYRYLSLDGELLGEIWRFDNASGKEFRPITLWRNAKGNLEWRFQIWPAPRPLYGLDRITAKAGSYVLIVEGEKAADAGARLLNQCASVSSPGGSNAAAMSDWTPLRGLDVVVWPDADAAGAKYADAVTKLTLVAGAASVVIIPPPDGVSAGWDLADAEVSRWTAEKVRDHIDAARSRAKATLASRRETAPTMEPGARKRGVEALLDLVDAHVSELFHDARRQAYAAVAVRDHKENLLIQSEPFEKWLALAAHAAGLTPPQ